MSGKAESYDWSLAADRAKAAGSTVSELGKRVPFALYVVLVAAVVAVACGYGLFRVGQAADHWGRLATESRAAKAQHMSEQCGDVPLSDWEMCRDRALATWVRP